MDISRLEGVFRSPTTLAWTLTLLALAGYALLAFDQGHLFSLAEGAKAFDTNFVHELVHDARHSAGFPCH